MASFNMIQHLSSFPENSPTLFIPRVFKNITRENIWTIFENLNLGEIWHVEMIPKISKTGEHYHQVSINVQGVRIF